MPKQSMTVNEAVEVLTRKRNPDHAMDNGAWSEIFQAMSTLEGVRLCDESEARDIIQTLLSFTSLTPNEYVPQSDRARRWLAEHGGE